MYSLFCQFFLHHGDWSFWPCFTSSFAEFPGHGSDRFGWPHMTEKNGLNWWNHWNSHGNPLWKVPLKNYPTIFSPPSPKKKLMPWIGYIETYIWGYINQQTYGVYIYVYICPLAQSRGIFRPVDSGSHCSSTVCFFQGWISGENWLAEFSHDRTNLLL